MPPKVVTQKSFVKGVQAVFDRFTTPKGSLERSSNFLLSDRGALTVVDGTQWVAQDTTGLNPGSPIRCIGLSVNPQTFMVTPIMAALNGVNLAIYTFPLDVHGGTFTNIGLLPLTANWINPQFVNFAGVTIISLGNDKTPYQFIPPHTFNVLTTSNGTSHGVAHWQADHYYTVGDRIVATDGNPAGGVESTFQVVNVTVTAATGEYSNATPIGGAGFSGHTQPQFQNASKGPGSTVADNQLIWMLVKETTDYGKEAVPHGAAHIISHADALWCWNTAPATTSVSGTGDGPSVLRMSQAGNPNSWPLENSIFIGKDDGTQGTGMASFTIAEAGIAPQGNLIVFKDFSTYSVTGVFGAPDFGVTAVKTDMGCLASRTVQFATGFGILRFCHVGFAQYDGISDRLISEDIRPYIFGIKGDLPGVDFTRLFMASSALVNDPLLYVALLPTTDDKQNRLFCYDLTLRVWTVCDYMNGDPNYPVTFMQQVRPPYQSGYYAQTLIADTGPGQTTAIRRWQCGDTTWDATTPPTPVSWSFKPPEVGDPSSRVYFRRANVRLAAPAAGTLTGAFNVGDASLPNNAQPEQGAGPSSGAPPDVTTVAKYNGNLDLGVSLDIGQTGPSLNGTYSGSGPAIVEGVDYHMVTKNPRSHHQAF